MTEPSSAFEQPFPLRRLFMRRIVPGLVVFVLLLSALAGLAAFRVTRGIYAEISRERAQVIERAVAQAAPTPWAAIQAGDALGQIFAGPDGDALRQAFADEAVELRLTILKVYDNERRVMFSTLPDDVGKIDDAPELLEAIQDLQPKIDIAATSGEGAFYEVYVPVLDGKGNLRAVFEMYEPVSYLDTMLWQNALPAIALPGGFLLLLALALYHLVRRAQMHIDSRTEALNALRRRLESFVSSSAVDAARGARGDAISSRKITCSLFYSDVRDFSGYAETHSAEEVVDFLNRLMGAQMDEVEAEGGDVDKMVGDALLVRFEGPNAPARSLRAAKAVALRLQAMDLPRRVGIGVFTGDAISGAVGPERRRDFTVIGDSVNIAARLCSASGVGEVTADAITVQAEPNGFGPEESIQVKGRKAPLAVRRWRA